MTRTDSVAKAPAVSLRSVALPNEHGGWGFLIEPIILGLIAAFSAAGVGLGLAAAGVFLLHQPAKIAAKDYRRGRVYARTRLAWRFVLIYGALAAAGFALALLTGRPAFLLPLLMAAPFALIQLWLESRNEGRRVGAELLGALVLGATAPAILLAADASPLVALAGWLLLAARSIPSILYVRTRLRKARRGQVPASAVALPLAAHVVGVGVAYGLGVTGLSQLPAVIATLILLVRAGWGLLFAAPVPAKIVGIQEVVFGLMFAVLCAVAIRV